MVEELEGLRNEIRKIDHHVLRLVRNRLDVSKKIGAVKRKNNLSTIDLKVESEVIRRASSHARCIGLDEGFSKRLMNTIIAESIRMQKGVPIDRASYLYEILEKSKELEARGAEVIRLDVGEPDLTSPLEVKDALRDNLYEKRFIGYSSSKGIEELRDGIATSLNQRYGTDITKDQLLVTPGGKFAIFAAIFSKISIGDRVVIPQPTWPVYEHCTRLAQGKIDLISTSFEKEWRLDLQGIEEAFSVKPNLFIICSPNNPTGQIIPENDFREILALAEREDVYILSDEVYAPYSFKSFTSILQLTHSNMIYVDSFSKRFGMTGWRVGYAVSDAETISKMRKVLQLSVTCVPEFVQKAALKALTMDQERFKAFVMEMRERVKLACQELERLPLHYVQPDGGMYIFPKVESEGFRSRSFAHRLLDEKHVAVTPGAAFGDYFQHFRISLGINRSSITKGIRLIGEMVEEWLRQ